MLNIGCADVKYCTLCNVVVKIIRNAPTQVKRRAEWRAAFCGCELFTPTCPFRAPSPVTRKRAREFI